VTFQNKTIAPDAAGGAQETLIVRARRLPRATRAAAVLVALLAIATIAYLFVTGGTQPAQAMPAAEVTVATPLQRTIVEYDEYTGRFEPSRSVEIRPRVSGQLQAVHFADGDYVRKGQLLFTIDQRPFQAELAEAQARLNAARTAASLATIQLRRAEQLLAKGFVSRDDYDSLSATARSAGSNIAAAEAVVRQRALDLEFTRVRAPIGGKVSDRRIDAGSLVTGGNDGTATVLTTINAMDPVYFSFDVSESLQLKRQRDRAAGATGAQLVEIRLQDEPGYSWRGRVDFTDNGLDANSGTIRARAVIPNRDAFLTPGMFGSMRTSSGRPVTALLVPDSAVLTDQAGKMVMTLGPKGQPIPMPVTVGPVVDGLRVIKSGLPADARVIVRGHQRMMPGLPIQAKLTRIVPEPVRTPSVAAAAQPASSATFAASSSGR
jgi:RND family efflux transporter MFP subunit